MNRLARLLVVAAALAASGCVTPLGSMLDAANMINLTPDAGTFNQLDCNRDGKLSYAEVGGRTSIRPQGAPGAHAVTVEEFKAADVSGDGSLDAAELRGLLTSSAAWSVDGRPCAVPPALGG